jgi:hypothetical protein
MKPPTKIKTAAGTIAILNRFASAGIEVPIALEFES